MIHVIISVFFCMMIRLLYLFIFFFFNDTATTEIYTLSLHDALPISDARPSNAPATWSKRFSPPPISGCLRDVAFASSFLCRARAGLARRSHGTRAAVQGPRDVRAESPPPDRKSTRLNSSHSQISYAVFC